MNLDDHICCCFHISRRKLISFCRKTQPRVASQLSECGGAGTGCGWCIPFLKKIFAQEVQGQAAPELEALPAGDYAEQRRAYHRETGRCPTPGTE